MLIHTVKALQKALYNFLLSNVGENHQSSDRTCFDQYDIDDLRELITQCNSPSHDNLLLFLEVKIKLINLREQLPKKHINAGFKSQYEDIIKNLMAACEFIQEHISRPNPSLLPISDFTDAYNVFVDVAENAKSCQFALENFVVLKPVVVRSALPKMDKDHFSNPVFLANKQSRGLNAGRDCAVWFWKKTTNANLAAYELITQELTRFYFSANPKTRIGINSVSEFGILSKEVKGFFSFESILGENKPFNMDELLAFCAFTMAIAVDVDLRTLHLGLDENGNMVKLDGGCGLAHINPRSRRTEAKMNKEFTAADFNSLPDTKTFLPFNWLHYVSQTKRFNQPNAQSQALQALQSNATARSKMHLVLLRTILAPDSFFETFVGSYIKKISLRNFIASNLCDQRNKLIYAYINDDDFKRFIVSVSNDVITSQIATVATFKAMGKRAMLPADSNILSLMFVRMNELKVKLGAGSIRAVSAGAMVSNNRFRIFQRDQKCQRDKKRELDLAKENEPDPNVATASNKKAKL